MKKNLAYLACLALLTACTAIQQTSDQLTGMAAIEQKKQADVVLARTRCQEVCFSKIAEGQDLSVGPCLSEKIIPDWVCDVVHAPRSADDDKPANQCGAFARGEAKHFVEVDGNCSILKVY